MKNTRKRKKPAFIALMITAMIALGGCNSSDHDSGHSDRDSALLGKWRAYDGTYFELWSDGSFETNLEVGNDYFTDAIEKECNATWSSSDGQLTFITDYFSTYEYIYKVDEYFDADYFYLITTSGKSSSFLRPYAKIGDRLIGEWSDDIHWYTFNEDGTGSYQTYISLLETTTFPIQWSADDQYLTLNYAYFLTYDFYISSEDTLTLYGGNGSLEFKKITSHN